MFGTLGSEKVNRYMVKAIFRPVSACFATRFIDLFNTKVIVAEKRNIFLSIKHRTEYTTQILEINLASKFGACAFIQF